MDAGGQDHGKMIGKLRTNIREKSGRRSGRLGSTWCFTTLENHGTTISWELYDRNSMGKYGKQFYK
jgi:hypothetical protein